MKRGSMLTIGDRIHATPASQQVRTEDANVDRDSNSRRPPPNNVANKVDLLLGIVLSPEADATDQERPVDGAARIGMRSGKTSIVLEHQQLQFGVLPQKVHPLRCLFGPVVVAGVIIAYQKISTHNMTRRGETYRPEQFHQ